MIKLMKPMTAYLAAIYAASLSFNNADRCENAVKTLTFANPEEREKFKRWGIVSKTRGILMYDRTLEYAEKFGEDYLHDLIEKVYVDRDV